MLRPYALVLVLVACGSEPTPAIVEPAPAPAEATDPEPSPETPHAKPGGGQATPIYACPMHPQETSNEPGDCSQCGMALVKQEEHDHGSHDHGDEAKPAGDHDGHGH